MAPISQNEQSLRFIEAAHALGADEEEAAFKAKLAVIARQTPKKDVVRGPSAGPEADRGAQD